AHRRGSGLLRVLARVVLWSLIVVGAFRGLLPAPGGPAPAAADPPEGHRAAASGDPQGGNQGAASDLHGNRAAGPTDRRAVAVAVAFLREYLTVGDDQTGRAERLGQLSVAGADLRRSVSVPPGVTQYTDLVVAAGSRSVAGGIEVTVLAHVLQLRSGAYRDGGTLAFAVPLAVRRDEIAVAGRPRPAPLPVASGLSLPRPRTPPADLPPAAGRVARQAVVALVNGDTATLARLGGGRAPSTSPLPNGWRALSVGTAELAGPPGAHAGAEMAVQAGAVAAMVPVRVRPPTGPVSYLVPVRVQLDTAPRGPTVRQVDAGGSP
ncbi:MAG TPA: hypothetical protein VEY96_05030, partial [Actinomycetes bacterium]|nr:hypothetical protein [Actinomycetes bacterium]